MVQCCGRGSRTKQSVPAMECELEEQRRRKLHMYAVIYHPACGELPLCVAKAFKGFKD